MKRAKGLGFFIIAVLLLALTYTSVFGIYYYYGDIRFTTVKGLNDVATDPELGKSAKVIFRRSDPASSEEGLTREEIDAQTDKLLEALISRLSLSPYRVTNSYVDYTRGCAVIDLSPKSGQSKYDFDLAMNNLTSTGHFVIVNTAYTALGYTAANVIFDNDQIAHVDVGNDENGKPTIVLTLNDEGTSVWANYTEQNVDGVVSAWMDSSCICEYTIKQVVRNGKMTLSFSSADSSGSYTSTQILSLAYSINAGNLPFATEVSDDSVFVTASAGRNVYKTALAAAGAALLVLCALLIIRYRIEGAIITVCALAEAGIAAMLFSGYFEAFNASQMQISGLLGAAAVLTLTLGCGAAAAEAGKRGLDSGNSIDNSLDGAFRDALAPTIDACAAAIICAAVIGGTWNYFTNAATKLMRPIVKIFADPISVPVDSLAKMLLYGGLCCAVLLTLFGRLMTRSASRASYMRDPRLFGGKKND